MKKFKEYGLRKLNSILNYGNLMIFTETPTIEDDDCYIEADGFIEFQFIDCYKIKDLIQGVYIHHYTEDEEYVATYKFRPTQKDMEELEMLCDRLGLSSAEEEGNQESLLNAVEQLMNKIEVLAGEDNDNN